MVQSVSFSLLQLCVRQKGAHWCSPFCYLRAWSSQSRRWWWPMVYCRAWNQAVRYGGELRLSFATAELWALGGRALNGEGAYERWVPRLLAVGEHGCLSGTHRQKDSGQAMWARWQPDSGQTAWARWQRKWWAKFVHIDSLLEAIVFFECFIVLL